MQTCKAGGCVFRIQLRLHLWFQFVDMRKLQIEPEIANSDTGVYLHCLFIYFIIQFSTKSGVVKRNIRSV